MIEDAAHSLGTQWQGRPVGSLADLTCFSFNPVKNLGAMGDAGAVVGSTALIEQARMYRDHGRNTKFVFEKVGFNARIDNMQSNILLAKLPYLENWNKQRQMIATRYDMYLDDVVRTPRRNGLSDHVYYVYVIRTIQRDQLQQYLKQAGITTNIHYPKPCHTQPAFADHYSPLPRTEAAVDEILSLPCYPGLSRSDQDYIIEHVRKFFT
jgi:dTDP-4-amino-4,6-dideoxygalactose transaminase